jgi:hypothetical protein
VRRPPKDIGTSVTTTADTDDLNLFDPAVTTDLIGIRIFDVGQGDCIGLLNQSGEIFCYVDYGGLNGHPLAMTPSLTSVRMPVALNDIPVSIILTHWDKDHYYSAVSKNPAAQVCEWLVPRQMASMQAVMFAAKLPNAKCWPESIGDQPVRIGVGLQSDIEIRKCKPFDPNDISEDRNVSGLVVSLLRWDSSAPTDMMLLPGDCHFDGIPNIPNVPIRAMLAYHHGSSVHWTAATTSAISNIGFKFNMAYSVGQNSYGHPVRTNYKHQWDPHAVATSELRIAGLSHCDFKW